MNIHLESKDSLSLNLFAGDNSPDAKPDSGTRLAARCIRRSALGAPASLTVIASAPLSHFRWMQLLNCFTTIDTNPTPCLGTIQMQDDFLLYCARSQTYILSNYALSIVHYHEQ
jgi:hypothetical protein